MLDENLRKRLAKLLRKGSPAEPARKCQTADTSPEAVSEASSVCPPVLPEAPVKLAEFMGGQRVVTPKGEVLEITGYGAQVLAGLDFHTDRILAHAGQAAGEWIANLEQAATRGPVMFFDLETCGLSNAPIFLVGLLICRQNEARLVQYLAEDLDQEAALVEITLQVLQEAQAVVTYNGKTFDLPFLRVRAAQHLLEFVPPAWHLDLLPLARKQFRELPNHKLQTLEQYLLHRHRVGDVPGALIAETYYRFAAEGALEDIVPILAHNAWDLASLAQVLGLLIRQTPGR